MGSHFSGHKKTTDRGDDKIVAKEKELLFIKDHPDRMKRRSSATPLVPPIKEERILEDLCDTTDIEPDVPANAMGKRDVNKLLRKISVSEKFTTRFQNSDQFLQHVRRLSDPHAVVGTQVVSKRSSSLEIPSVASLDSHIRAIQQRSAHLSDEGPLKVVRSS